MNPTREYVDTKEYRRFLESRGFKYSQTTNSLFLSYPFVPKEFIDDAVRVELATNQFSPVSEIKALEFYRRGSGYSVVDDPGDGFKDYAQKILEEGVERARPKNLLV